MNGVRFHETREISPRLVSEGGNAPISGKLPGIREIYHDGNATRSLIDVNVVGLVCDDYLSPGERMRFPGKRLQSSCNLM